MRAWLHALVDGHGIRSFVALGDSFTEGMQDDLGPDGRYLGWADRLAAALSATSGGIRYANLAVRGRLLDQVVTEQVPVAVRLSPDLVSFHAGVNDALRPRSDLGSLVRRYRRAVEGLAADLPGRLLLFTVVGRSGGTGRTADVLAARFELFSRTVRVVGAEVGAAVVDLGSAPALGDRRLWHEDRLHLAPAGHARVAAAAMEALGITDPGLLGGEPGWWRLPLTDTTARSRPADLLADARWGYRYLLPWVGRRLRGVSSGDSVLPKHTDFSDLPPRPP